MFFAFKFPNRFSGYEWTDWLDRDDPSDSGDFELLDAFEPYEACRNPLAIKVQDIGPDGSFYKTHLDLQSGFYCLNEEQENGKSCSDFAVSFCCPVRDLTCEAKGDQIIFLDEMIEI